MVPSRRRIPKSLIHSEIPPAGRGTSGAGYESEHWTLQGCPPGGPPADPTPPRANRGICPAFPDKHEPSNPT